MSILDVHSPVSNAPTGAASGAPTDAAGPAVGTPSAPGAEETSAPERALPVRLRGLGQRFGAHAVLGGIDLDVPAGHVVALLGASGCGKSTLLRVVAGLDPASEGEVILGQTPVSGLDPRCAVGFQEPRLLPWRSVRANVELGLPQGTPQAEGDARVDELLRLVGLDGYAEHRPREISGGMAQRASLARALARRPSVLLLDEPFGALDALTRLRMQELLLAVHAAHPTTVLLVTHDVDEALRLADTVVVLEPGANGAGIGACHRVDSPRPRRDDDAAILALRHEILARLGVHA